MRPLSSPRVSLPLVTEPPGLAAVHVNVRMVPRLLEPVIVNTALGRRANNAAKTARMPGCPMVVVCAVTCPALALYNAATVSGLRVLSAAKYWARTSAGGCGGWGAGSGGWGAGAGTGREPGQLRFATASH